MIHLTLEILSKSIEKAKQLKPLVKPISERTYAVHGKNDTYIVKFEKHNNQPYGECTCPAGLNNRPCYHIASSVHYHMQRMIEQRELKRIQREQELIAGDWYSVPTKDGILVGDMIQ